MVAAVSFRKRYCGISVIILLFCFLMVYNQMQNSYIQNYEPNIGWEFNRSRNATEYVLPDGVTSLISSKNICSSTNSPRVLLIVCSSTENFTLRKAIRQTWAYLSHKKFNISVAFLMGVSTNKQINRRIQEESLMYDDVIVEDFIDTYNNLTIKTLMLLKWVKNNCASATYVMKTDDDVYINIKSLAIFIDNNFNDSLEDVLYGQLICAAEPVSDISSKWFMPSYMYSNKLYPNYLAGYGYLMSMNVALKLYEEAFTMPIVHMEDVFISGLCALQAGIKPSEPYMFHRKQTGDVKCSLDDNYLVIYDHTVTHVDMFNIHRMLTNCVPSEEISYLSWLFGGKKSNRKMNLFAGNKYSCEK